MTKERRDEILQRIARRLDYIGSGCICGVLWDLRFTARFITLEEYNYMENLIHSHLPKNPEHAPYSWPTDDKKSRIQFLNGLISPEGSQLG